MQTMGLVLMAVADIDINLFLRRHPRRLAAALWLWASYYALNVAATIIHFGAGGLPNLFFLVQLIPFGYAVLRFRSIVGMHSGYLKATELCISILTIDLFINGIVYGPLSSSPRWSLWPSIALSLISICGTAILLQILVSSRNRRASRTISFKRAIFIYLFFFGVFYISVNALLHTSFNSAVGLSQWLFGIIHVLPSLFVPCKQPILSALGRHFLRHRLENDQEWCGGDERGNLQDVEAAVAAQSSDLNDYVLPETLTDNDRNLNDNYTLLHCSCWNNHLGAVSRLLSLPEVQINKVSDLRGWSALYIAARLGHAECVELLIAAGADVNQPTDEGETPLLIATAHGHTKVMSILMDAGATNKKWMGLRPSQAARSLRDRTRTTLHNRVLNTLRAHESQFVGNVLDVQGCNCTVSWPGIYARSWDKLVAQAKADTLSAAVVFLPEVSGVSTSGSRAHTIAHARRAFHHTAYIALRPAPSP